MNRLLHPLTLLAILLIAGCADTETPPPKKRSAASTTSQDSQFTSDAFTNAPSTTDGSLTETNNPAVNDAANLANPFATPTPVPAAAPRDLPYGTPVPGKPGFVTSPHSPTAGYVDVRGFPPGSEVKDPYVKDPNKPSIFLVP
jgi:hypothetical protein